MKSKQADNPQMTRMVSVRAPARLHLGFLDLNATLGRKFGSIGLAIDSHHCHLRLTAARDFHIHGTALSAESRQRLLNTSERFYQTLGQAIPDLQRGIDIELLEHIPEHAGLGSGTQLALTLGTALARFHQIETSTAQLAQHLERGKRSGIGIATFDQGGFVVDGGLKPGQSVPPVLMQQAFPSNWRIVLLMDHHHQGVHGQIEKQAFQTLPIFPLTNVQAICHLTLMQLLPALVQQQLDEFGSAITQIQALVGDHFAAVQGGRYTSRAVAACLEQAQKLGHTGIAQSSWGPTGCVFVDSDEAADMLIGQLTDYAQKQPSATTQPDFIKAGAARTGAIIETATQEWL
ncbi:beta-ribofuranosylaminobenzene 5'-phosphate synthase family protein [Methylophaga sp. OBS4]|uniref:beta-ribofuranosylaminobenzene 5'-phosphate synthase family protein n=1 Tax=Methylophaga sp. OBS4 TaxID=2991935 RepID=UPI0022522D3E|nr:beta-ribofuranosylaminobenzene 5'-phosphate synthase family protein [Methylophaga sp. OBS4]MCX4188127.1 beta-hydroxylase [Methylophaga sp. OBS4]